MTDEQGVIYSEDGKVVIGLIEDFEATKTPIVVIPEGVTEIETGFCANAQDSLKKITLPSTLQRLGSLLTMSKNTIIQVAKPYDCLTLHGDDYIESLGIIPVKKVILEPEGAGINLSTFKNWKFLEEVIITSDLYGIHEDAFSGCENLRKVKFQGECPFIEYGVFSGCDKLEEINIPASTEISDGTFDGKNAWRNRFVDLGLPSGTRWERTNVGYEDNTPWGKFMNIKKWTELGYVSSIPTKTQFSELISLCTWEYLKQAEIRSIEFNAYKITGLNGNTMLLPVKNMVQGDHVVLYASSDETDHKYPLVYVRPNEVRLSDTEVSLPCFLRMAYKCAR